MQAGKNRIEDFYEAGSLRGAKRVRNIVLCFLFKRETCGGPGTTMSSQHGEVLYLLSHATLQEIFIKLVAKAI